MPHKPPAHKPPRLPQPEDRPSSSQRGYDARWRWLRAQILIRDCYLCQVCQKNTPPRLTTAIDVDHIIPHAGQGDPRFWDWSNLQSLCKSCHSAKTAREDGGFGRKAPEN